MGRLNRCEIPRARSSPARAFEVALRVTNEFRQLFRNKELTNAIAKTVDRVLGILWSATCPRQRRH
jgi:hypothetical protein